MDEVFAADVAEYLERQPRQLPSKYFYDPLGSALFEAICRLPCYRITRSESALLQRHARDIVSTLAAPHLPRRARLRQRRQAGHPGRTFWRPLPDGALNRHLLSRAADGQQPDRRPWRRRRHRRARSDLRGRAAGAGTRTAQHQRADARAVPRLQHRQFRPRRRPRPDVAHPPLAAKRATRCCSAATWSNPKPTCCWPMPTRCTSPPRSTATCFAASTTSWVATSTLDGFGHRAVWNAAHQRVEMHLVSRRRQTVEIAASNLKVTFRGGDAIWTESSYKFRPDAVVADGLAAGFSAADQWARPTRSRRNSP